MLIGADEEEIMIISFKNYLLLNVLSTFGSLCLGKMQLPIFM